MFQLLSHDILELVDLERRLVCVILHNGPSWISNLMKLETDSIALNLPAIDDADREEGADDNAI